MAKLVTKFRYYKPGGRKKIGGYAKYIALRDGVERCDDSKKYAPVSYNQKQLIAKILRDYPDSAEMLEYDDYKQHPTVGNASEFISRAIEDNAHSAMRQKTYADYIATRPRAEKVGSHGLFSDEDGEIVLSEVAADLNTHEGNVWTMIVSLRREDAERLGYNNARAWQLLLRSHTQELADALRIPLDDLKWYSAFHNESHHPHIHVIAYTDDPKVGYLSKNGVEQMRSALGNHIFRDDLQHIFREQTEKRNELKKDWHTLLEKILADMAENPNTHPEIEARLAELSLRLSRTKGKKVYGYLKRDIKDLIDEIVDLLAEDENIAILQQSVTVDPIMKKRKKNTGEALMYYVQNSHPAIVTREKFNKAQEERARRRTFAPKSQKAAITATGKYSRYALSQVMICAECGSPYKRVHWNIRGKKSIVWRCVNRLDHGTQYCKESPTLREDKLKEAVVRAIRQFNEQDANTYTTLMKATIAEAIGFDGSDDEKELLERQVNGLNDKMITIVNESIASGEDIESREAEIKEIADTIEDLKRRIQIITENSMKNAEYADRIAEIERIITERASHQNEYDDSIVRQMVECIKVYADKHIEVIFGGGYTVEETVE